MTSDDDLSRPTIVADAAASSYATTSVPIDAAEAPTADLLARLLWPANVGQLADLLATHDLRTLARLSGDVLLDHGLSPSAIDRLAAVLEFAKRYGETTFHPGSFFRGSGDIYAHFRERLAAETTEHFYAVLLDNKHRKIRDVLVSKGSLTSTIIHPRDVFLQVIRYAAAAVVFVHNHPSGDPTPSKEDLDITRRLRDAGDIIGVRTLDHVIIGQGRYVSFVDDGYW